MPICILKAYFCESFEGERTVRFVCGPEEDHERMEKAIVSEDDVEICLAQFICAVDVNELLYPPQPIKGEEKLKERLARGLHIDE